MPNEIAKCRELTERGTLAMQQGSAADAEEQFRSALQANPADVDARRLFAEALWVRSARAAAIAQMEIASQLAPQDAALTVRLGEMLLASGGMPAAIEQADRAIAENPRYGPAWALRGRVHAGAGRLDRAVADLQRALVHAPGDKSVLLDLGEVYLARGQARRGLTTVQQLLDLYPPGSEPQEALFLAGRACLATGRPADAADRLLAATGRGAPRAEIFCELARAEAQRGRTDAAIRAAHHALATDSTHRESQALLAELHAPAAPSSEAVRR